MFLAGLLSPFEGGEFGYWTKVYIRSCDGGAYMGNNGPIQFKNANLTFRGSLNTEETFKWLQGKGYLSKKDEVVISGSYNGAIAAMQWATTLQTYTNTKVRLHLDGGLHLNQPNHKTNEPLIQDKMIMLNKLFLNDKGGPNTQCNAANSGAAWKCFFVEELYKYVDVPVFLSQSLYDGRAID